MLYDCNALVIPLQKEIKIKIENNKDKTIINSYNNNEEIDHNKELTLKATQKILSLLNIKDNIIITSNSELPISSGLGSSAGFSVALINTLAKRYKINFSDEEKFKVALEAEKIFHGATLGIDILATMLQKPFILSIEKNNKLKIKQITNNLNLHFLLISTGKKPETKTMVEKVKQFSIKNKERFNQIIEDYKQIINNAEDIINNQENIEKAAEIERERNFAELINKNHALLKELDLSNANIEKTIALAKTNGALAAKITGAGNGGYVLALVQKNNINNLKKTFIKQGYDIIECGM